METSRLKISVLGSGAWGSALATHLAGMRHQVCQWMLEPELAEAVNQTHVNHIYLPHIELHPDIYVTSSLEQALKQAQVVLLVMPSQFFRNVIRQAEPFLKPGMVLLSCTKGIETQTGFTMGEIILDELNYSPRLAALSGPSFASEVAQGAPTGLTVASDDEDLAILLQQAFSNNRMRLYTSTDLVGVELGGAIKNPLAIAAGMIAGLSLGHNSLAGMITRGCNEMGRLIRAKKGHPATVYGLAGMGDLVLTCTSPQSRNYTLGYRLAQGEKLEVILASTPAIAEGVVNTDTVLALAGQFNVEMPIISAVKGVISQHYTPLQAVDMLMSRDLKSEF